MGRVFATADIGSNTVHLLVAERSGDGLRRIQNVNAWLSLGEVVGRHGVISQELVDRLVDSIRDFRELAEEAGAEGLYVFATEAVRSASNRDEVLAAIKERAQVAVDVISAQREAELGLRGALLDSAGAGLGLFVEIGGGSVQLALFYGTNVLREVSLPLGTGRISAEASLTSPASAAGTKMLEQLIALRLETLAHGFEGSSRVVASGGVARGIWRALHPDGSRKIHAQEVEYLGWAASRLDVPTLCARFGVKSKRASTLHPGARLLGAILKKFGHAEVLVSEFGVREGAIFELAEGKAGACRA